MRDEDKDMFRRASSHLLREAAGLIDSGDPAKALWRVVDAAGMLSDVLDAWKKRDHIGAGIPTGRGYQIVQATAPEVKVRKVQ